MAQLRVRLKAPHGALLLYSGLPALVAVASESSGPVEIRFWPSAGSDAEVRKLTRAHGGRDGFACTAVRVEAECVGEPGDEATLDVQVEPLVQR